MLEKPKLAEQEIAARLHDAYGLELDSVEFLPIGADADSSAFRAVARGGAAYFVKVRSGTFDETSVALPKLLAERGIREILAPLATKSGELRAKVGEFTLIVYPFVRGRNGYEVALSDSQWVELGAALKLVHATVLPAALSRRIPRESWSGEARCSVRKWLEQIEEIDADPVAMELARFMESERAEISELVERSTSLATRLKAQTHEFVVCHSDIHAGNVLVGENGEFYIVDWDAPILAPKERDLMFAGGGQFGRHRTREQEEGLFYRGYGETAVDAFALAYYRYERIVLDLAVECEMIFLHAEGGADRERELEFFVSNFLPGGVIEIAYGSDTTR